MLRSNNADQLAQQVHFNKWMQRYGPLVQRLVVEAFSRDPSLTVVADALMASGLAKAHKHAPLQLAGFTTDCLHTPDLLFSLPAASITYLEIGFRARRQDGLSVLWSGLLARFTNLCTLKISIDADSGAAAGSIPNGFLSLLHSLTHLTHLKLDAGDYTWGSLQTLPQSLREADLTTTGDCLVDLAHLSCLTSLALNAPHGFATGSAFPNSLTHLDLQDTPLSRVPVLTKLLSHVQNLSLYYLEEELAELPAELGVLPSLQTVKLTCMKYSAAAAGSAAWRSLAQLHGLSIQSVYDDEEDGDDVGQILTDLAAATSLTSLRLWLTATDRPCGVHLGHLRNLRYLDVTGIHRSRQDMLHLRSLTQLTKLELADCILDDGVAFMLISNLTGLRSLVLQNNLHMTDAVLSAIVVHLRGLEVLEFVVETGLTSASAVLLSELTELTALTKLSLGRIEEEFSAWEWPQLQDLFGDRLHRAW
jgi:Leucine-rich repeat (LRR) protein